MKKYEKPEIEVFEVEDIIAASGLFEGITSVNKSKTVPFSEGILDPEW